MNALTESLVRVLSRDWQLLHSATWHANGRYTPQTVQAWVIERAKVLGLSSAQLKQIEYDKLAAWLAMYGED